MNWLDLSIKINCGCSFSDAWRCARSSGRTDVIACRCKCHSYLHIEGYEKVTGDSADSKDKQEGGN